MEADTFAGLGAARREWDGLSASRIQTRGGLLKVAPQSHHWLTVQVSPSPTQTELQAGRKTETSCHLRGCINVIPADIDTRWLFDAPTDDIILEVAPAFLARVAADSGRNAGRVELVISAGAADATVDGIASLLHRELGNGGNGKIFGDSLATALAAHLLTNYAAFPATFKRYEHGMGKTDLKRILNYIGDHLDKDISLEILASLVAISPFHFCRLFKQSTGLSPHQYVIRERVERAKSLLLRGNTVTQAAFEVGFSDAAHLHRHFKQRFGITPGTMLQRERGPHGQSIAEDTRHS